MKISKNKEMFNLLLFISLLFILFILSYLFVTYELIILFVFGLIILLFGSFLYGCFSKNQIFSALFGFLIYPVFLAGGEFNNLLNTNLDFEFIISCIFSEIMLMSILNAAIGWLAASDLEDRDKQMFRYMTAVFLFVFYLMIFTGAFHPN
ncbi:hypothetical protein MmiEs2_12360 [Methanimicrococcus stummii]|uniref:Uncharacterized protein n=1 Tax=Methanimicrococcus stummii TaxID=3028294 RepID=A0AA96V948_9EURY|nr:hypothetical protein [Methanimicrococcus sp. Es2]WNY29022.1 hypothetical protein MmiEs2_12360 [Methanimicrococcus sp. Es2]